MFKVVNSIDRSPQLSLTPHLVDPFDLAELFPRCRHQLLLLTLDDSSAERGNRSMAWVEIQLVEPCRDCRRSGGDLEDVSPCVPATIDRWRNEWVYTSVFHCLPGYFQNLFKLSLKSCLSARWPIGDRAVGYSQSAFELERCAGRQRRSDQ